MDVVWHHDISTDIPLMPSSCSVPFINQDLSHSVICKYGPSFARACRDKENCGINPNAFKPFEVSHGFLQKMQRAEAGGLGYRQQLIL